MSTTGFIIASVHVASLTTSLLITIFELKVSNKFYFCLGSLVISISNLIFGQLIKIFNADDAFIVAGVLARVLQGVGSSLFWCSGSPMLVTMYPNWTGKLMSCISFSLGTGIILGAPIGGFLYSKGGYILPFTFFGLVQFLLTVLCYIGFPTSSNQYLNDQQSDTFSVASLSRKGSFVRFLTTKGVPGVVITSALIASTFGFLFASFADYLRDEFGTNSSEAGAFFLAFTVSRVAFVPFFGILSDKGYSILIFSFGNFLYIIGFTLLGVSNRITLLHNWFSVEFMIALLGISTTAAFVPFVPIMQSIFIDKSQTDRVCFNNIAAIMYTVCLGLGSMFGSFLISGALNDLVGFETTCFFQSLSCLVTGSVAIYQLVMVNNRRKNCENVDEKDAKVLLLSVES